MNQIQEKEFFMQFFLCGSCVARYVWKSDGKGEEKKRKR